MNNWVHLQFHTIVREVLNYEYDYYCQIHDMKPTFMHIGHYQKFLPNLNKEDYLKIVDEKFKLDYLSKVKTVIDCSYYYSCKMGMDNTHMYPDEIMSHINNLLKMKQDDAFEHLELTKKRLLALKLNKELPKNSDVSNKKGKI